MRVAFGALFCFVFCVSGHAPAPGAWEGRGGSGRGRGRRVEETRSRVAAPAASGQQGAPSLCLKPRFCRLGGLSPRGPRPGEGGESGGEEGEGSRETNRGEPHSGFLRKLAEPSWSCLVLDKSWRSRAFSGTGSEPPPCSGSRVPRRGSGFGPGRLWPRAAFLARVLGGEPRSPMDPRESAAGDARRAATLLTLAFALAPAPTAPSALGVAKRRPSWPREATVSLPWS